MKIDLKHSRLVISLSIFLFAVLTLLSHFKSPNLLAQSLTPPPIGLSVLVTPSPPTDFGSDSVEAVKSAKLRPSFKLTGGEQKPTFNKSKPEFRIISGTKFKPKIKVYNHLDQQIDVEIVEKIDRESVIYSFDPATDLPPGKYRINFQDDLGGEINQDFYWGVLAINFNKSVYNPLENGYLSMAVLDETGDMVCDARLTLTVEKPDGTKDTLSTEDNSIKINPECLVHGYTEKPDYETEYAFGEGFGTYKFFLTAETKNGSYSINDQVQVAENIPIEVDRIMATRIYPPSIYEATINLKANEDFHGIVEETVPLDFIITKSQKTGIIAFNKIIEDKNAGTKKIRWNLDLLSGQELTIGYRYDIPDISPEFYLVGPLKFADYSGTVTFFEEKRQWQLAADAGVVTLRGTAVSNSTTATTTFTITIPAGVATGDDMYVLAVSRDHASGTAKYTCTDNDSGGNTWTEKAISSDRKTTLFWKKATAGTASKTITLSGGVGSFTGGLSVFYGGATGDPTTNIVMEENASRDEAHAGFTPDYADSFVMFGVTNNANDNAVTDLAAATLGTLEPEQWAILNTGGADCAATLTGKAQVGAAAATGGFTWAQTNRVTVSISFAIKPYVNYPPTVELNSPGGGSSTTDTTPDLVFTGTDADSEDIRYNIQIDTVATFDSGDLLDKVSGTDTGFASIGDSDPFTSAQAVTYTVQPTDALPEGTYYWRVAGKDPSGSNTYGAWSSPRSFIVSFPSTAYPFQRKTWYDGTRWWKALNANSRIEFWYSDIGTTWTENTNARIATNTKDFSVETDSSNLFIAYNDVSIKARVGTTYPATNFSWSAATTAMSGVAGWYDASWGYRKMISIGSTYIDATLSYFPVMIGSGATDPQLADVSHGGHVGQADGGDIVFTNSTGTKLDHEIEKYDETTGKLIAWVEVDSLSSTVDTDIYMYYGNTAADNQWNISGTWDSDYRGVWHFNESSGTHYDATSNNNDSISADVNQQGAAIGKIDGADEVIGSTNGVKVGDTGSLEPENNMTVESWVKLNTLPTVTGEVGDLVDKDHNGAPYQSYNLFVRDDNNYVNFRWTNSSSTSYNVYSPAGIEAGLWYHIVGVRDGSSMKLYINGSDVSYIPGTPTGTIFNSDLPLRFGSDWDGGGRLDGIFDEVRISGIARSPEWIAASYKNINTPDSFYEINEEEAGQSYNYPTISRGSNNKVWIAATNLSVSGYTIKAVQSTSANDITAWETAVDLDTSDNANKYGTLVPVGVGSSYNMYSVWIDGTTIEGKKYSGVGTTGWAGSADSIGTGITGMTTSISLVGGTGDVGANLVYIGVGGSAIYRRYTDSWQTAVVLDTNSGNEYSGISIDKAGGDGIYSLWIRDNDIFYKRACSPYTTWGGIQTLEDTGINDWLTTGYSDFGSGKIFVSYIESSLNSEWASITPTACGIGVTTTGPTLDQLMRHGGWFNSGVKQPFTF